MCDDAESRVAHETTDALTLSGHARTPSGCKSGDIKRTIIKKKNYARRYPCARGRSWANSVYSAYHWESGRPFPGPDVWIDI
jgi:hypothetical protein